MSVNHRRRCHVNSVEAFYSGKRDLFSAREQEILTALSILGKATDREIAGDLGFGDMNAVRPRITELIADGVIEDLGSSQCPVTRRHVRMVRIALLEDARQLNLPGIGGAVKHG